MSEYKPKFEKPKITPIFKKRILKDWQLLFSHLVIKPPLSLKRRVGPLLISIGFDIKSDRENYYPGFGVHNLCNPLDFLTSTLDTDLRTIRTNATDWLTVRAHEEGRYIEAAERMKQQAPLPLEGPISLNMIIEAYKKYIEKNFVPIIDIIQDPALIAAWAGQPKKAHEALEWGCEQFTKGGPHFQSDAGGFEGWKRDMQERISNPEKLRVIAEEQAVLHKVDHIPMEKLIID